MCILALVKKKKKKKKTQQQQNTYRTIDAIVIIPWLSFQIIAVIIENLFILNTGQNGNQMRMCKPSHPCIFSGP